MCVFGDQQDTKFQFLVGPTILSLVPVWVSIPPLEVFLVIHMNNVYVHTCGKVGSINIPILQMKIKKPKTQSLKSVSELSCSRPKALSLAVYMSTPN